MKLAIVYDRVNTWGGAERLLLELCNIFPNAELYTSLYSASNTKWVKKDPKIYSNRITKIPKLADYHQLMGTLMPLIFESYDFSNYDLVISVTSEAAKGVITSTKTRHICYMLTPTRYLWSHYKFYFDNKFLKALSIPAIKYLRKWDYQAAQRPEIIIAISKEVQKRIKKYYKRESFVLHPPLMFPVKPSQRLPKTRKYFLIVSRLVPYKRVDLAIEAFNELGFPLYIIGKGRQLNKLKRSARENIRFLGELTDGELAGYYRNAKALIFPQEEDFGLVAVESIASGTPVIAFKKGGVLDIIKHGENGIFFNKQIKESLKDAVKLFDSITFNTDTIIKSASQYSKDKFEINITKLINNI